MLNKKVLAVATGILCSLSVSTAFAEAEFKMINFLRYYKTMYNATPYTQLMQIPLGSGIENVGGIEQDTKNLSRGLPMAFRPTKKPNEVWVLDSINESLKLFKSGRINRRINLNKMGFIQDFAINDEGNMAFLNRMTGNIFVTDNKGNEVLLSAYKGTVLLIVNTATGCGLTPQYKALQTLYDTYNDQGFEILDFPCNQFLEQAKGTDEEIHEFCTLNYHTSFPRFAKIDVNGENAHPLFKYLKEKLPNATVEGGFLKGLAIAAASKYSGAVKEDNDIRWNFTKFLVSRDGNVLERFDPTVTPDVIDPYIKKLINIEILK